MSSIGKVRSISVWIFIIPFVSISTALFQADPLYLWKPRVVDVVPGVLLPPVEPIPQ